MEKSKARELLIKALDEMKKKAEELGAQGVAVASFLDKDDTVDWIGEMKVVETPTNPEGGAIGWNLVAIAWSKAGEVIATGADSGNPERKLMTGEYGFVGGAYGEYEGCKLAFAFSGSTSENDLLIAKYGIEVFKKIA